MNAPTAIDRQWLTFRKALERAIGVPLGQYKEPQMKRRLASVMARRGIADWPDFAKAITTDQQLLSDVRDTLTINVSEFFRQPDRFIELQNVFVPRLLKERRTLRFWSAGCSIGCEPYSLAMILNEVDPNGAHQIIATDVDMPILQRAREGSGYFPAEVRSLPANLLKKYMVQEGGTYRVVDSLKKRIQFRKHDLLSDSYPADLDVILCRNVVIYFTDEAKQIIYTGFSKSLRSSGLLFIGGSEMIMRSGDLGLKTTGTNLYQKVA